MGFRVSIVGFAEMFAGLEDAHSFWGMTAYAWVQRGPGGEDQRKGVAGQSELLSRDQLLLIDVKRS